MFTIDTTESVGLHSPRWQSALDYVSNLCERDLIPSAGLFVARSGKTTGQHLFGRHQLAQPGPIRSDAIFLVASITKPVVATGLMLLIERGQVALGDRVTDFIPEFGKHGKYAVTVRHLLTHTSGLPDMLPNNTELRAANAPLSTFVEEICGIKLDFPAGRGVQYQSMGFAILGEIIQRVSGESCAEFLREEFFEPLGMQDTELGATDAWFDGPAPKIERIAEIRVPEDQQDASWNWNRRYWRSLGAPWGGLLTTPADLAKFAQLMLNRGTIDDRVLLAKSSVDAATRNQLEAMPDVPEIDRRCRPWGLGWRLAWPAHSANFGDLLGLNTYGHWGATGTILWIDPDLDTLAIFLTTQPQEPRGAYLSRVSNAIAAAIL